MVGAENEFRLMLEGWSKSQLKEFCADQGMKWQFTTPTAPQQNGCSEAMVKTMKKALKKAIGDMVLTPFELYTCLLEVANLVNQRPNGRIPNNPDDGAYLCPNDILLVRASRALPQGLFRQTKNPCHRFEFCQKIADSFWKKWAQDVLPCLVSRKKWHTQRRNVVVNAFVIVADANPVRGKWSAGRVHQVFPGEDGIVRNVQVKISSDTYMRPITKICLIYPAEGGGGMLHYRNRNGLDANLRPFSSRHFICNTFFVVFVMYGLLGCFDSGLFFSFGTDFKSMYLTRLDKCEYF